MAVVHPISSKRLARAGFALLLLSKTTYIYHLSSSLLNMEILQLKNTLSDISRNGHLLAIHIALALLQTTLINTAFQQPLSLLFNGHFFSLFRLHLNYIMTIRPIKRTCIKGTTNHGGPFCIIHYLISIFFFQKFPLSHKICNSTLTGNIGTFNSIS